MSAIKDMLKEMLDEVDAEVLDDENIIEGENPFPKKDKKDDKEKDDMSDEKDDKESDDKEEKKDKKDDVEPEMKEEKEDFTVHLEAIKSIFKDTDISEEKVEQIGTIFTAAVHSVVAEKEEVISTNLRTEMEKDIKEQLSKIEEDVDNYLTYSAEEYIKENELTIESGIKSEMTESFLSGMKTLFTEHYVDIPEDKVDVIAELSNRLEESEDSKNVIIEENIESKAVIADFKKGILVSEMTKEMTDTDREKIQGLVEAIDFVDVESFKAAFITLKENYLFSEKETKKVITEEEAPVKGNPNMNTYLGLLKS